jgi:hypothetical protein
LTAPPSSKRPVWRDASRDPDALARAAAEFFEEGYEYPIASKILADTPVELQAEARGKLLPRRTVPDGCYVWASYLIWLERVLDVVDLQLAAAEVEGLMILRRERNRFESGHPPCPRCGMPNALHLLRCRECMAEIGK